MSWGESFFVAAFIAACVVGAIIVGVALWEVFGPWLFITVAVLSYLTLMVHIFTNDDGDWP